MRDVVMQPKDKITYFRANLCPHNSGLFYSKPVYQIGLHFVNTCYTDPDETQNQLRKQP